MNAKLLAGVSILALTLGACQTTDDPKLPINSKILKYKTDSAKYATSIIPDWYEEMPSKKGSIFTVGSATAPDLQLAVDIATLNGKVVLADRINGKLSSMTKSFIAKFGQSDINATVLTEIEKVAKNVVATVDVAGYAPAKVKVYQEMEEK